MIAESLRHNGPLERLDTANLWEYQAVPVIKNDSQYAGISSINWAL
jgi:hypothetical protein